MKEAKAFYRGACPLLRKADRAASASRHRRMAGKLDGRLSGLGKLLSPGCAGIAKILIGSRNFGENLQSRFRIAMKLKGCRQKVPMGNKAERGKRFDVRQKTRR
jgi:hypothetical protein